MVSRFGYLVFLLTFSFLFFSISSSPSSDPILKSFIQCFQNTSQASTPISSVIFTYQYSSFSSMLVSRIDNRRYSTPETPKPLAIVEAESISHIRTTIFCARRQDLQVRVRGGGHDFEGIASVSGIPFVILDMHNFRNIDIDMSDETAWVEAGASLGELYYKIGKTSKVLGFSASVCHGVCTGGHFSGGGYGNMMRKYGLSVDNVLDAKIMDVNGRILDRKSMGEDVFWALRGGGGGSFGVILSWKIKLNNVPEIVTVFNVERNGKDVGLEAIYRWQYVAPNLPNEVFIRAMAGVNGSEKGNKTVGVSFIGMFLGRKKELLSMLADRFPELSLKEEECREMSWVESTVFWYDYPIGTPLDVLLKRLNGPKEFYKIKSDYVKQPISKPDLESIFETMSKIGIGSMKWNPYGGRMSEISESETPFPHRAGNLFLIQYLVLWSEEGADVEKKYVDLARELYEKMTPFVSENPREAFLNYRDFDIGENPDNQTDYETARVYGRKFFKDNFDRLVKAKTSIDPDNFFKNHQSIPTLPKME